MLLIDGHVHLEHQDYFPELLDRALTNMRKISAEENGERQVRGMLFLAEMPGQSWRFAVRENAEKEKSIGGKIPWSLRPGEQKNVIICENGNGDQMVCLTGQQVNTSEKLELLLFGHDEPYLQESLLRSVEKSVKQGSLIIIPWGVGKWLGKRGRLVLDLMEHEELTGYMLGDNGNRPVVWKKIPQFIRARKKNIPIIGGTDPLFLPGQIQRVGSYGTVVSEKTTGYYSVSDIRQLFQKNNSMKNYGALQNLHSFITAQIALRLMKAKKK
jgi:hypothetical protein